MLQSTSSGLIQRQYELERESTNLGVVRYQKALEGSEQATTGPGRKLVMEAVEATAQAIRDFVTAADTGRPGKRHAAVQYLRELDPEAVAYLTAVCCVNSLSGKKHTLVSTARTVAAALEQDINYRLLAENHPGLYRVIQRQVKKATSARYATAVMNNAVRKARESGEGEGEFQEFAFTAAEQVHVGSCLVDLFATATGLIRLTHERPRNNRTVITVTGTEKTMEWLEKAHNTAAMFLPVWMPMLVPPRPWTGARDGGYLSDIGGRADLVRTRNRAFKAELEHAELPEVLTALNAIQETPWAINGPVLDVMVAAWEGGGSLGDLPARDLTPLPPKPEGLEREGEAWKLANPEEFKEWKRSRAAVYEENARGVSKRVAAAQKIALAEKFRDEEAIYFPHNLDFRGRAYPIPALLTPQGNDQSKGLLRFAKGVRLGEDGAFWLAVHLANCFGVDKVAFEDRVAWVRENEEAILDSALNPLDGQRFWDTADDPWQALAACFEWAGYCLNGDDHISHLPVALDGSCNGLQNFSAMLRDEVGGKATNLVPQDQPADIYTEVLVLVQEEVRKAAEAGKPEAIALDGLLDRNVVKQPVMTLPYGVTLAGMRDQVLPRLAEKGLKDAWDAAGYLATLLWNCIGRVVIAARHAMDWLKEAAKVAASADLPLRWTSPVGFPVLQDYRKDDIGRMKVHVGGVRMDISRASTGTKLDRRRQAMGIAPNFVHSYDASHMMLSVNLAAANGIEDFAMVHDSYGTHAGNAAVLAAALRQAFVDQYRGDVLANFRDELVAQLPADIAEKLPPLPETGNLDLDLVMDSPYFFA